MIMNRINPSERNFSFIKLDLDKLQTRSDFQSFCEFHSIPLDKFDIDYFLEERQYSKVWILDPITFEGMFWIDRSVPDQILLLPSFSDEIESLPSYIPDMNLDSVLDKLSKVGLSGLSIEERKFLDDQSTL